MADTLRMIFSSTRTGIHVNQFSSLIGLTLDVTYQRGRVKSQSFLMKILILGGTDL